MNRLFIWLLFLGISATSHSIELSSECKLLELNSIPEELLVHYKLIFPSIYIINECYIPKFQKNFRRGYSRIQSTNGHCFYEVSNLSSPRPTASSSIRTLVSLGKGEDKICETKGYAHPGVLVRVDSIDKDLLSKYFRLLNVLDRCINSHKCLEGLLQKQSYLKKWFDLDRKKFALQLKKTIKQSQSVKMEYSSFFGLGEGKMTLAVSLDDKYRWLLEVEYLDDGTIYLCNVSELHH